MNAKSIIDYDRKSFKRFSKNQLPHSFKKVGIIIFITCFVGLFVNAFSISHEGIKMISKYGLLISLLIISISKDKVEDERITQIRMQSFTFAFIAGVFMALVMPFADYFVDYFLKEEGGVLKDTGDWVILWILLTTQVLSFEAFKRVNQC